MKSFEVTEDIKLKDFTDSVYPQGSFCLAALLRRKDVKVNGVRVKNDVPLKKGDKVDYYTTYAEESKPSHKVVYEDENIYIADKFSGVSSEGLYFELSQKNFFAVHRLDRNTEGLIAFAKTERAKYELLTCFKDGKVKKTYIALCKNNFKNKSGRVCGYILKDEKKAEVKVYKTPIRGGLYAVSDYEVVEERGDIALVKVTLHTGRTHQIRAQMASIGCPVLGDEKYGDNALNSKYFAKRQRLVSKFLEINSKDCLAYLNGKIFESSFTL